MPVMCTILTYKVTVFIVEEVIVIHSAIQPVLWRKKWAGGRGGEGGREGGGRGREGEGGMNR